VFVLGGLQALICNTWGSFPHLFFLIYRCAVLRVWEKKKVHASNLVADAFFFLMTIYLSDCNSYFMASGTCLYCRNCPTGPEGSSRCCLSGSFWWLIVNISILFMHNMFFATSNQSIISFAALSYYWYIAFIPVWHVCSLENSCCSRYEYDA